METIETNAFVSPTVSAFVSTAFEPCAEFGAAGDGSSVCVACGWLDAEHELQIADVHALPAARDWERVPKRLAS